MRCPNCNFVGPDHRDVCSKCYLDLREHKKAVGVAISNSWATHEELLRELGIAPATSVSPEAPKLQAPEPERTSELPQPVSSRNEVAKTEKEAISQGATPVHPIAGLKFGPRPKQIVRPEIEKEAARLLFEAAEVELRQNVDNTEFELTSDQDLIAPQREGIRAMFALARDVFDDPTLEQEIARAKVSSADRKVEADSLSGMLKQIESTITTPVVNLRSAMRDARLRADEAEREEPFRELERANAIERLSAFCIDLAAVAVASYILAAVLISNIEGSAFSLAMPETLSGGEPTLFWSLTAACTCLLSLFYPLVSLTFYRSTLGLHLLSLRVVNERFRRIRNSHALVRSLSFPLAIISGIGVIGVLFGKRALHDWSSRTLVCRAPTTALR
ncbi:MAG: RDD family protein [Oligoflexia bacterium]|nr:RDD family protein [Oligoflexia bacterium]